jgi:preprotein translocase subunit SecE
MDNRKIILAFYVASSAVLWALTRGILVYLNTFYQVRRLPGIDFIREALPIVLALACFIILIRHTRVNEFMEEVVSELRKVTWPGREEVVRSTFVVIVCIAVASLILGAFDMIWGKLVGYLMKG